MRWIWSLILPAAGMFSIGAVSLGAELSANREQIANLAHVGDMAIRNNERAVVSLKSYDQALELAKSQNDYLAAAALLNIIGGLYEGGSDYQKALTYYENGLKAIESKNSPGADTFAHDALESVRRLEKGYREPTLKTPTVTDLYRGEITNLKDFLAQGDTKALQELQVMLMINAGNMYLKQRQFKTAETDYKSALVASRIYQSSRGEQESIANLAWSAIEQGNFTEADSRLDTLMAVIQPPAIPVGLRRAFLAVGVSLREQKRYAEAQLKLEEAVSLYERAGDQRGRTRAISHLAQLFRESGNVNAAKAKYLEALRLNEAQSAPDLETTSSIYEGLAKTSEQLGDSWSAISYYDRYAEIFEEIARSWGTDQGSVSYREAHSQTWSDYINLVMTVAAPNRRYDLVRQAIERTRSRSLLSLMEATQACRPKRTPGDVKAPVLWPKAVKRPYAESSAVQANIMVPLPTFIEDCQDGREKSPGAHAQAVTFLEYYMLPGQTVILVKSPQNIVAGAVVPIGERDFEVLVSQYLEDLEHPVPDDEFSRQLYAKLIAPIEKLLPDESREPVVIVPHRSLWLLPFSALKTHQEEFFGDKHVLSYAASESIFQLTGARERTADHRNIRAWIMANPIMPPSLDVCRGRQELEPLVGAQTEGEEIQKTLGADRVELFIRGEADRLRLEAWHPNFTIVHFATHGIVCPDDPLSSTLVLADLNGKQLNIDRAADRLLWTKGNLINQDFPVHLQDMDRIEGDPLKDFYYRGALTARDIISHFNLEADLVALSACRTALGKLMGEGMIGFTRAFMATGARSVLVSLWRVDDWATEALMVAFYKEYAGHGNKGLALQTAMRTVRERYPHPKDWAAFSLFGPAE